MATPTAEPPEDDEAWLYGDPEKKEEAKAEAEAAASTLSADAPPFEPAAPMEAEGDNDDKEAGEVSGEDPVDDDEDSDDDDVQVTIGDIKTQPQTYEKFKSGYTRSGQAKQHAVKGVDLETPGTINDQSIFDYDLNSLNVEERAWRKPGADITDYFNYGFTEETWMKYCDKQKYLRNENGVTSKMFIQSFPSAPRRESAPLPPKPVDPPAQSPQSYRPPTTPTQQSTSSITVTPTSGQSAASLAHMAGPPPGRKMSGTIDVIGGTRSDSRRPKNMYDYENQSPSDSHTQPDYSKKWTPTDLPPPHIPPPNYGVPPPMSVPPPGPVPPPPPHMTAPPPLGYYPAPTGPPPDRGPPPGYDNRGAYGYENYGAPPPGYGAPPPVQPTWDNRGSSWDYGSRDYSRDRSPVRSDSDFSSSGDEYEKRRYRGRQLYDPFERDLNYERNRQGRPRSRERERGESSSRDRERRHRDRERADREKEDRHRRSRKEGSVGAEHKSKHKKSKRSKRDKDDESMDTSQEPSSSPPS